MKKIMIINGPNLNLLGKREPEVYGSQTFEDYLAVLQTRYPEVALHYFQSNSEGELIDKIHEIGFTYDGIILNAGKAVSTPVVEVHISNTFAREAFRHRSYLSPVVKGCIVGFGMKSYELALQSFIS